MTAIFAKYNFIPSPQPLSHICHSSIDSDESILSLAPIERYTKLEKLGEGNYGMVYKARDNISGEIVALKKIKLDDEDDGVPSTAIREIAILQEIKHQHAVKLLDLIFDMNKLYLSFEYYEMNLRQYLDAVQRCGGQGMEPNVIKLYIYQLLECVEYCHSRRILHRDLKPQNILVDGEGRLKVADFGLARATGIPVPPVTHEVATLWYRAPEILLGCEKYSGAVDVWGVATIMLELATAKACFPGDSEIDTIFKIFQLLGTPSEAEWPGVTKLKDYHTTFPQWPIRSVAETWNMEKVDEDGLDLLHKMFDYDPIRRISARAALSHPWFKDFDIEAATKQANRLARRANTNFHAMKNKIVRKHRPAESEEEEEENENSEEQNDEEMQEE